MVYNATDAAEAKRHQGRVPRFFEMIQYLCEEAPRIASTAAAPNPADRLNFSSLCPASTHMTPPSAIIMLCPLPRWRDSEKSARKLPPIRTLPSLIGVTDMLTRQNTTHRMAKTHQRFLHSIYANAAKRYIQPICPRMPHQLALNKPPSGLLKAVASATRIIMPAARSHLAGL